jgi:hypothetical protein
MEQLKRFHPDSQVDLYNVVPLPTGGNKYLKLQADKVYLEDDGAIVTIELKAIGVRE